MATVAKLSRYGNLTAKFQETQARVQNGLAVFLPMTGSCKPTPVFKFDHTDLDSIPHSDQSPNLFKLAPTAAPYGILKTVPALVGAKYILVEWDQHYNGVADASMILGFLDVNDGIVANLYAWAGRIGMNTWQSDCAGANMTVGKVHRVSYLIDPANMVNNKIYLDGVLQTMVGPFSSGKTLNVTGHLILGNGRIDSNSYLNKQFWGNLSIYTFDYLDQAVTAITSEDREGTFIGQPVTNLATTVTCYDLLGATSPVTITQPTAMNPRWKVVNPNATAGNFRLTVPDGVLVDGRYATASFKYKTIAGTGTAWITDWCDLTTTNRTFVYPEYTLLTGTGMRSDYNSTYRFVDVGIAANTTIELWDFQVEHGYGFTNKVAGTAAPFFLKLNGLYLPTDHTLIAKHRHVLSSAWETRAVTKSGNTFVYYKNGVPTTQYQNVWKVYAHYRPTVEYYFSGADCVKRLVTDAQTDGVGIFHKWNPAYPDPGNNEGYLFRTHVYSDADVRVWHRYTMDDGGYIRVNRRDIQTCGNWNVNTNPDVYIDLKVGWNLIELWGMDGASGGWVCKLSDYHTSGLNEDLTTSTNKVATVKLSEHPNVKYMTSELPIDYLNGTDKGGWTSGLCACVKDVGIYTRALSAQEIGVMSSPKAFRIQSDGTVSIPLKEDANLWPDPDLNTTTYGVRGNGPVTWGIDANGVKYHEQVFATLTTSTYKGYDVVTEAGATYILTGEFWRSAGSSIPYRTLTVEGATSVLESGALWSALAEETWTKCQARFISDGNARCLIYASGSSPGALGTIRWRKLTLRKVNPSYAMRVGESLMASRFEE